MATAHGEVHVEEWKEAPYHQGDGGRKLTKATVTQKSTGDIEGTVITEYLMAYRADGTAEFVGMQRIDGTLGGKRGMFVTRVTGSFDGTVARAELTIVSGAGSGELATVSGTGAFAAPHGPVGTYTFDYEL